MSEQLVGKVTHYYGHIGVAGIEVTDHLEVGDTIHVKGHTTDFTQDVGSIEIEHGAVEAADAGDSIGVKVEGRVREHDEVFRVE